MDEGLRRAKRLLARRLKKNDPSVIEFFQLMIDRYPDLRKVDDSAWRERWHKVAKSDTLWVAANLVFKVLNSIGKKNELQ